MTSLSFWTTFYAMMSTDLRVVWTIFLVLQLVNTVNSPGAHVRDAHAAENSHEYMCTPSARVDPPPLQYSRHQLLSVPPSGLDATAQSTIRQLGIGYRLPKMRTHRAGRRKQNPIRIIDNINSLSTQTNFTHPNSTATGRSDNHRHRDLISVSLQPDSQSSNTGFRIALFNAQSVGSSEKHAKISTFVSDNGIDLLFITATWLNPRGDEAKIALPDCLSYWMKTSSNAGVLISPAPWTGSTSRTMSSTLNIPARSLPSTSFWRSASSESILQRKFQRMCERWTAV